MRWLVDGSNVLGTLRWNREARESKERLAALCARFARHERKKLTLCFDGAAPAGFATKLGGVSIRFCHPRSADDVIVGMTRDTSDDWCVVTSDAGVANRVRRRTVKVVSSQDFGSRLERIPRSNEDEQGGGIEDGDWESYFSDPKNRVF